MRDLVTRLEDHDAGEKLLHEAAAEIKALRSRLDPGAMFEFVKHGDAEHQAWLREAFEAYVAGKPKPEPRGLGKHGAKIAALEAKVQSYASRLEAESKTRDDAIVECYAIYRDAFELVRYALTFSDAAATARGSMSGAPGGGWEIKGWEKRAKAFLKEREERSSAVERLLP